MTRTLVSRYLILHTTGPSTLQHYWPGSDSMYLGNRCLGGILLRILGQLFQQASIEQGNS